MFKTIIHTCSSVLLRPNGITRYINYVIDLQKRLGHKVIFVSDAKPTQTVNADEIFYVNEKSLYEPNFKDGHVWLQIDHKIAEHVSEALIKSNVKDSLVISHDLHSYLGAERLTKGIFVQHESDVLNLGERYSYISDEYLERQVKIADTTDWQIGFTVPSDKINPKNPIYTPAPFVPVKNNQSNKTKSLLYIGDASERKGAKEFMALARRIGIKPTVITHDLDQEIFKDANVYSFGLNQKDEMYELMSQHKVAYMPSKNECLSIAALECLQFMPLVVDTQYSWTKGIIECGAIGATGMEIDWTISNLLEFEIAYDRSKFDSWIENSKNIWQDISNR